MFFKQFYLGCLAHASYLIGSDGEAAVIDPQRDVEQYLEEARRQRLAIRYVIETHLHADFVSGHRELAGRTGAEIVFGRRAGVEFPHRAVTDGDELALGNLVLRALETPGHTPEGVSWLLVDPRISSIPLKVLTGDTLFVGDVGRPDLAGSRGYTPDQMAGLLYDSLHQKLLTLPDAVEVWPAHGAGSSCGRNISKDTSSTIGEQRRSNYALAPMSREQFVSLLTTDLPEAPSYFAMDAEINRRGAPPLASIEARPLSPAAVEQNIQSGSVVLDVRDGAAFGAGHLEGSINIGLAGQYASWSGNLLSADIPILVVADGAAEAREAVLRLARVGLENVVGYLDGGIAAWNDAGFEIESLPQMDVAELRARSTSGHMVQVVDVRTASEYGSGHVPGAINLPLGELDRAADQLDRTRPTAVVCAGGYRSAAGASLLQRKGLRDLYNVIGGTAAWKSAGYETEA